MTSFLPRLVGVGSVKLIRSFHTSYRSSGHSYEGEGKTTVTILNRDNVYGLMIDSISSVGFKLNNGLWILGPMIIFPRSVISWNIQSSADINEDSLTLFKVLEPPLDILVVGLDQKYDISELFIKTIKNVVKKQGTSIEILPVDQACTTFNFLNADQKYVAAALLPPRVQLPPGQAAIAAAAARRRLHEAEKPGQIKHE